MLDEDNIVDDERGLTLLQVDDRLPLPKIPYTAGRPCYLPKLVKREADRYEQLILLIKQGVYYHVAAEAAGINQYTFIRWGNKGRKDLEEGKDTYYSRFVRDVRRSVAHCRSHCEIAVREVNPGKWLSKGPGRLFGNQWSESRTAEEDDTPMLESKEVEQIEDKTTEGSLQITSNQELEKFELLEQAGLLTLTDEYRKALQSQANQEKADAMSD